MHIQSEENLRQSQEKTRADISASYATQGGSYAEEPAQAMGYRPSPAEEAQKNFHYHSEQASKAGMAAKFLAAHPEFARFIELIREGAIAI